MDKWRPIHSYTSLVLKQSDGEAEIRGLWLGRVSIACVEGDARVSTSHSVVSSLQCTINTLVFSISLHWRAAERNFGVVVFICEPSCFGLFFTRGGEKAEYLEVGKLVGLVKNEAHNAQWTLGLSELVAFHIDSCMRLSMVFFPINLGNKHWVAAAWNLDDYVLMVYDSLE
ncbi:auxin transport protein BIG [Tanacetum coccineum]|uniref:Auxin transport protein BIG n=1 Tax=Tanacetum coccineum TaxID=301880 RepID=A0ABQ5HSI3_9ASTR